MNTKLRALALAATLLSAAAPASAQTPAQTPTTKPARELVVLSIGLTTYGGLTELAAAYTHDTGLPVRVDTKSVGQVVEAARSAEPAPDLILLPVADMDALAADRAVAAASRTRVGRVGIGLVLPKGAPRPDISTPEKVAAALKAGGRIGYTDPSTGSAQAKALATMLAQPRFAGVNAIPFKAADLGGAGAVRHGTADIGLQPIGETLSMLPDLDVTAPLPDALGAYIDMDAAIPARAGDAAGAKRFLDYVTRPAAAALWRAKGVTRGG